MTTFKVQTSLQLVFRVPVTVNNFSLTAVCQAWVYGGVQKNEFEIDPIEIVDYEDLPSQCCDDEGRLVNKKMEIFRESYKNIFGSRFNDDVSSLVEKLLTKEIVTEVVKASMPKKIITSVNLNTNQTTLLREKTNLTF